MMVVIISLMIATMVNDGDSDYDCICACDCDGFEL